MKHTGSRVVTRKVNNISSYKLNFVTLAIFAPLLIVVGIAGFVVPAEMSLTSGATPYNVFHIVFGLIGLGCLMTRQRTVISSFNAGFGLIDLYQALASVADLPPKNYFLWTRVDDILHVLIGAALLIIGCYGLMRR